MRRVWRVRRRVTAGLVPVVACAAVAVAGVTPASAGVSACTAGQLVPLVRAAEANQGLPGYGRAMSATAANPLVWGKDTLVKLYLSLPSTATCDSTGQSVTLAPGSTLSIAGASSTSPIATPMTGGAVVTYSQAPAVNSIGDPVWPVPGSAKWPQNAVPAGFEPPQAGQPQPTPRKLRLTRTSEATHDRRARR